MSGAGRIQVQIPYLRISLLGKWGGFNWMQLMVLRGLKNRKLDISIFWHVNTALLLGDARYRCGQHQERGNMACYLFHAIKIMIYTISHSRKDPLSRGYDLIPTREHSFVGNYQSRMTGHQIRR